MSTQTRLTRSPSVAVISRPELFSPDQECINSLALPSQRPEPASLQTDLSVAELNGVHQYLSIVGSPDNISPLHHQEVLRRKVVPSQATRLHLVWFGHIIYVKPLPDCLLNAAFWRDVICRSQDLYRLASGFLRSYCRLIESPLDLRMAQKLQLINETVTCDMWYCLRIAVLQNIRLEDMNERWIYGELRLGRLNLIWRATGRGFTYFTIHREYATYFNQHFNLFITVFALVATILQAMQVIVAIKDKSRTLNSICYGFSLATLVAVVACLAYVLFTFFVLVLYNVIITAMAHNKMSLNEKRKKCQQDPMRSKSSV
jgi:hypothetical protein